MPIHKQMQETVAKVLGYEQAWTKNYGHGTNNDGSDVLLWTKDENGKLMMGWNPQENDADLFKLCLQMGVTVELDKDTQTVTATYISPLGNPGKLPNVVSAFYGTLDFVPVARRIAFSACYEMAKAILHKRDKANDCQPALVDKPSTGPVTTITLDKSKTQYYIPSPVRKE